MSLIPTSVNFAGPVPAVAAKNLRSGEGDSIGPEMGRSSSSISQRKREELVSVINLHYCSAKGLIHVGVLPKPDIYTYHRMVTGKKRARAKIPIMIVTHKRIRRVVTVDGTELSNSERYNDLFDLSDLPSDGEDVDGHD